MILLVALLVSIALTGILIVAGAVPLWPGILLLFVIYLFTHAVYALWLLCIGFTVNKKEPIERVKSMHRSGVRWISWGACFYGRLKVCVTGKELLPKEGRYLFVSNHQSGFDPLAVSAYLPKEEISFVAKPSIVRIPMVGSNMYGAGFLPIDRENDRNALKTILTAADYLKKDICSIGIFPEGTRNPEEDGELLPFHAGSFKIAQRAGVPVVIAALIGFDRVRKNAFRRTTKVEIRILEVLSPERVKEMKTGEMSEYTRTIIEKCLEENRKK